MGALMWGMLGPDGGGGERRTRTLGLGAAVRAFNERAVPGMGGVWFAKQFVLSLLGVAVAERATRAGKPVSNIQAANAIEALACFIGLRSTGWSSDPRLLGALKLADKTDFSFARVSRAGFYVSQPMRMATVQALPALGLVEAASSRFNGYVLSARGQALLEQCAGMRCHYSSTALDLLTQWAQGGEGALADNSGLAQALSPLCPVAPEGVTILRDALLQGGAHESTEGKIRRRAALEWVETLRPTLDAQLDWERPPSGLSADHWHDLRCGAALFALRDSANALLEQLEHQMGRSDARHADLTRLDAYALDAQAETLREQAAHFLRLESNVEEANRFAQMCVQDSLRQVLVDLVSRDGRILRWTGGAEIYPGSAYLGILPWLDDGEVSPEVEEDDPQDDSRPPRIGWPGGISERIPNLFLFNADLQGDLPRCLGLAPIREVQA